VTKPLTRLMQQAIEKIGDAWGPYPVGVYCRTLDAMQKRGLIECRFVKEGNGTWTIDEVNVANMRHLWVLRDRLGFAWRFAEGQTL
jgi:hypothetical protein